MWGVNRVGNFNLTSYQLFPISYQPKNLRIAYIIVSVCEAFRNGKAWVKHPRILACRLILVWVKHPLLKKKLTAVKEVPPAEAC